MAEKVSVGQQDKKAAEERTAQVGREQGPEQAEAARNEARSAAELSRDPRAQDLGVNPYPNYDYMTVEELQALADERGVEINRDVLKAHLITELRAADTGVQNSGRHVR